MSVKKSQITNYEKIAYDILHQNDALSDQSCYVSHNRIIIKYNVYSPDVS